MRTLILGAEGQLGRDLTTLFANQGESAGLDQGDLDIAERGAVTKAMKDFRPDLVINAAAYTNVEGAEDEPERAFLTNKGGAGEVARAAAQHRAPVVYYSTDYVFDGSKDAPYTPEDLIEPASVYARSKAAGEAATRAANPSHFIVRTAWLYGLGSTNFVEKIIYRAANAPELKVIHDEVGSPTHTWDLAEATAALCATRAYGTFHAVNAGACSRYEFAKAILELAELGTPIVPCRADEFPTKASRPRYSVLSSEKLETATGHRMRPWREALRDYMRRREGLS